MYNIHKFLVRNLYRFGNWTLLLLLVKWIFSYVWWIFTFEGRSRDRHLFILNYDSFFGSFIDPRSQVFYFQTKKKKKWQQLVFWGLLFWQREAPDAWEETKGNIAERNFEFWSPWVCSWCPLVSGLPHAARAAGWHLLSSCSHFLGAPGRGFLFTQLTLCHSLLLGEAGYSRLEAETNPRPSWSLLMSFIATPDWLCAPTGQV